MSLTPEPTPSSRRGSALLGLRRDKGSSNVSTTSLTTSSTDEDGHAVDNSSLRASVDAVIDKVKHRARRSIDERSASQDTGPVTSDNKLGALLARTRSRAKKNRSQALDVERNGDVESGAGQTSISGNQSSSSLLVDGGSGNSSLLTEDNSESDGNPNRPSLSPRQSHKGYLTLSSPEINAQTNTLALDHDNLAHAQNASTTASTTSIPHIPEPSSADPATLPFANSSPSLVDKTADTDITTAEPRGQARLRGLFRPSSRRSSVDSGSSTRPTGPGVAPDPEKEEVTGSTSEERLETAKDRSRQGIVTTSLPATPPNLVDAPVTLVTPPTPTDLNAEFPRTYPIQKGSPKKFSSIDSIKHRRAQSAIIPSKLSTSTQPPLTPTVEEARTPGGTLTQPSNSFGFFSSFFTTAQKAADQFSNSIGTPLVQGQKSKPTTNSQSSTSGGEEVIPGPESRSDVELGESTSKKELAIETLGKGDLSLRHLGISETASPDPMNSLDPPKEGQIPNGEASRKNEEEAAARAVSSAYEKPLAAAVSQATGRPSSIASNDRLTLQGDQTPPRNGNEADSSLINRAGSVRSKLSGRRKHRASSATAGTERSIAAAIKDSAAGLANPAINGVGHRLTGFAVASSKRNKDFHQLFRSVPEDDYLIEDYSAALQKEILLHGRLYVSEGHICFSSNILGWVTNLVISFDEVVSVEKKSTAVIFPNAIVISTLQARNIFASFVARDSTYELLIGIWKISHPNLKSSLNGVVLDNAGTGDKTEVVDSEGSDESEDGTEDEVYDEDADDDVGSFTDAGVAPSISGSEIAEQVVPRKVSTIAVSAPPQTSGFAPKGPDGLDPPVPAATSSDFPGNPSHPPTECADTTEHYDKPLTDTTIPAPLGKVYSLMFGPASGAFMRKWLVEDQKSRELNYADDKTGLDNDHKTFAFDYIKPLNAPVGPRQTKCLTTATLTGFDLEKAVSVDCSTQTPDVPSGNVFATKTRYCLMWGPANSTRLIATSTVEWSGKSWLKGPIEKGANDGQTEYVKSLTAALKAAVTTKPPAKSAPVGKKSKRQGKKDAADDDEAPAPKVSAVAAERNRSNWGILEPLHQILEPVLDLLRPFITSQVVIAVLFALLAYTWFASSRQGPGGLAFPGYSSPDRIAAYEEIWRREESALWDWLDERVGLDGVHGPPGDDHRRERQRILTSRSMGKRVVDERMTERQMDDAIRTTEERLLALKDAVARQKERRNVVGENPPS